MLHDRPELLSSPDQRSVVCAIWRVSARCPEHLQKFDYVGLHAYFLTFCTYERLRIFTANEPVDLVLVQISRASRESSFAVIAYCFMPDHLHLLVEGRSESSDCKDFIKRAKQYSGFYYSRQYRRRLWQRYGFEHVLRDHEKSVNAARYIMRNPVDAGLVSQAENYPYSGSLELSRAALITWTSD